jgi:hypothetical protein
VAARKAMALELSHSSIDGAIGRFSTCDTDSLVINVSSSNSSPC